MAARPWVTPQEVKDYTEYQSVKDRADNKLVVDIARAEQYIIAYTNNAFEDAESVPEAVKTAVILIAEAYSFNATNAPQGGYKSETFDDYSYTVAENPAIDLDALDIKPLLDDFVLAEMRKGVNLRMRRL